jgi:hypothetical protein
MTDYLKRFGSVFVSAIGTIYLAYTGSSPDATVVQDVQTNFDQVVAYLAVLGPAVGKLLDGLKGPQV